MKMFFVTALLSVSLFAQCKAGVLSDLDAMEERKPNCSGSGRNNTCDKSDKVDRIYLALSGESKNLDQSEKDGETKTHPVHLPVISVVACYGEDPNPMHPITISSGETIKLNERFYLSNFDAKTVIDNKGEVIPNGQCEILVRHQNEMVIAADIAQGKTDQSIRDTVDTLQYKNGACIGAVGLAFTALTLSNPLAMGSLLIGSVQTGIFCTTNMDKAQNSSEMTLELTANSILARYLTLVQGSIVRQLRTSYELVKNAGEAERKEITKPILNDAELYQLWARASEHVIKELKIDNPVPLTIQERIILVDRLYRRVVRAFNSDLSIEDEILRCERFEKLPKDDKGRKILENAYDGHSCTSYSDSNEVDPPFLAEAWMKPEMDISIKQMLGSPRSLHDFFRSGSLRRMEGRPGVFEQEGRDDRAFTNNIRKIYLRDTFRECINIMSSPFYDRDKPAPERCQIVYKMASEDVTLRIGAEGSKTRQNTETVPTASLR